MLNSLIAIGERTAGQIVNQHWVVKGIVLVIATLAPIAPYVHFLVLLLIVDAATSIYYQYKQNKKKVYKCRTVKRTTGNSLKILFETVESGRLRKTFEKLIAYVVGIIVCFYFDIIVLQIAPLEGVSLQYFSISNIAVVLICSVELTSILATLSKITNNPVYDRIIKIFNKKIDDKINDL